MVCPLDPPATIDRHLESLKQLPRKSSSGSPPGLCESLAKSIAVIPAEAIPFLGVAVPIADTGYELYAACEAMRDLDELYLELGVQEEASGDAIHTACNPELPDAGRSGVGLVRKVGSGWIRHERLCSDDTPFR